MGLENMAMRLHPLVVLIPAMGASACAPAQVISHEREPATDLSACEQNSSCDAAVNPKVGVARNVFSGTRIVSKDFFGLSLWYVPWDASRVALMPDPSLYSINRYCTVLTTPNAHTEWAAINTAPGVYDWSEMDAWVDYHRGRGTDLLYEVGGWCPGWASARPAEVVGIRAPTEPADMQAFVDWLTAVGTRYDGKIKYWLMPNEPKFAAVSEFTGTAEKYAEMTRLAHQVLESINPDNRIVGPEVSQMSAFVVDTRMVPMLDASAAGFDAGFGDGSGTTGKDWLDIISLHPYIGSYDEISDPLLNLEHIRHLRSVLADRGLESREVWASEIMMAGADGAPHAERTFLARNVVLSVAFGFSRMIWFGYGRAASPLTQAGTAHDETVAHWEALRALLIGAPITSIDLMEEGRLRVTRSDGVVFYDDSIGIGGL